MKWPFITRKRFERRETYWDKRVRKLAVFWRRRMYEIRPPDVYYFTEHYDAANWSNYVEMKQPYIH